MPQITDETVLLKVRPGTYIFHYIDTLVTAMMEAYNKYYEEEDFLKSFDALALSEISASSISLDHASWSSHFILRFKDFKCLTSAANWLMVKELSSSTGFLKTFLSLSSNMERKDALSEADKFISNTQGFFEFLRINFEDVPEIIAFMDALKGQ